MRERPVLFSGAMVNAILEGRKTQTRRVIKPQPTDWTASHYANSKIRTHDLEDQETGIRYGFGFGFEDEERSWKCPYGKPGDRLWVREGWCHKHDDTGAVCNSEGDYDATCVHFKADGYEVAAVDGDGFHRWRKNGDACSPWKPSIHMPRWASRITLEIISVRVERLNDITEEDARAEGAPCHRWFTPRAEPSEGYNLGKVGDQWNASWDKPYFKNGFANLWESINGPGSWGANPWVWVIEFKVVQR